MLQQQILNGIINGSVYALIALGLTMVYGVLRILHFAHGAVYMIGGYTALFCLAYLMLPFWASLLLAMIFASATGMAIEKVAYAPLRGPSRLPPLIASIAIYFLLEDIFRNIWGASSRPLGAQLSEEVYHLGYLVISQTQVMILLLAFSLMGILMAFLRYTKLGAAMQAVAQDAEMAAIHGINVNRIISLNFAIGSALAGAAGVLIGAYFNEVVPTMGEKAIEKAFALVVLGGLGHMLGSIVAGLILGVLESLTIAYFDLPMGRDAIAFVLLIFILICRPYGLFGKAVIKI